MPAITTTVHEDPEELTEEITFDAVFFTLSNPRRRFVLHHLKRQNVPVSVGELATQVAAWENQTTVQLVTNKQRKRAYSALHQTHLPKMDALGIISYDQERGVVEPTPSVDAVDFYLEIVPGNSAPWHEYYLGLAALSAALFVLTWLQLVPGLAPLLTAGVVTCSILGAALYHNYTARQRKVGDSEIPPSVRFETVHFGTGEDEE